MSNGSRGFTVIELVMIILIVGVLASLAVSAYQTFTVRAQITAGINFAAGAKGPIVDAYTHSGIAPANREIDACGDLGAVLSMTPTDNVGSVSWACSGDATLVDKWLPAACR